MAMSSSTANWHWKSKGVTPWARSWFDSELPTVIFTSDDVTIGISKVTDMEGDVELGMRKSKLITIFDVKLVMNWTATHSNGASASGSLTIPEVSHMVVVDGLEDYTYDWTIDKSTAGENIPSEPTSQALYSIVKKQLPPRLTTKFETFPKILLDTHGKDLVASASAPGDATPTSGTSTPALVATTTTTTTSAPTKKPSSSARVNTSTVKVEAQFMVSASDLFGYLTDEARIPAWTRAPAKSKPEVGTEFSLFGGGVYGKYLEVEKPTRFVQSWSLKSPTWPQAHEGKLITTLEEQTDSTKMFLELSGVPKGQEDEIERNLMGYYINSLKSIGYVAFNIQSHVDVVNVKTTSVPRRRSRKRAPEADGAPMWQVALMGVLVASMAVWTALAYI